MDSQFYEAELRLDSAGHDLATRHAAAELAQTKLNELLESATTPSAETKAAQKEVAAAIRQQLMAVKNYKAATHLLADSLRRFPEKLSPQKIRCAK